MFPLYTCINHRLCDFGVCFHGFPIGACSAKQSTDRHAFLHMNAPSPVKGEKTGFGDASSFTSLFRYICRESWLDHVIPTRQVGLLFWSVLKTSFCCALYFSLALIWLTSSLSDYRRLPWGLPSRLQLGYKPITRHFLLPLGTSAKENWTTDACLFARE